VAAEWEKASNLGENSHADKHPDATPSMRFQPELKKTQALCLNSRKRPRKDSGCEKTEF